MARATKRSKEPGFEASLERLEEIVRRLEEGDLPLDESLRLFEEGVGLTRACAARLDEAERRIEVLGRGAAGEPTLAPYQADAPPPGAEDADEGDDTDTDGEP